MAPSKLDLHSLVVFYYVASEGSITAAAGKLCLTQPTVTYHIRCLERNVGLKLLDIKRQKVFLTRAGEGLLRYVKEIYQHLASAEKYLEELREGGFRIGISITFSASMASVAAAFKKLNPLVRLTIHSASSFEVAEEVLNSRVDLGIVVSMDYGDPKLKSVELSSRQKLVLVASPSSPIAQRERLDFMSLCGYPLVMGPETSATRRILLKKLMVSGCATPSPIIVEVNSSECGISMIESGQGVGLCHVRSVQSAIQEGRLKVLPVSRDIWVGVDALLRADAPEHPMAARFITLVKEALQGPAEKLAVGAAAA
jgi:DNA-binding transcriptional LysR family regulator